MQGYLQTLQKCTFKQNCHCCRFRKYLQLLESSAFWAFGAFHGAAKLPQMTLAPQVIHLRPGRNWAALSYERGHIAQHCCPNRAECPMH